MPEHRVIQADYTNWRTVAGRKVLQLILEVPIEQTAGAMKMLGVPMPGESRWCAIALLEQKSGEVTTVGPEAGVEALATAGHQSAIAGAVQFDAPATNSKDRRPFASLPLSQQAALRCQDNDFKLYLGASNVDDAASEVRRRCCVDSRAQLDDKECVASHIKWRNLEAEYQAYLTDRQYADSRR